MQTLVVAGAAFVGSGVVKFNPDTATYIGAGTGDIINTMITASIAVGMILLIGEKFGPWQLLQHQSLLVSALV